MACGFLRKGVADAILHKLAGVSPGQPEGGRFLAEAQQKLLTLARLRYEPQAQPLTREGVAGQYEHYSPVFKGLQEVAALNESWEEALLWADVSRGQALQPLPALQPSVEVRSVLGECWGQHLKTLIPA